MTYIIKRKDDKAPKEDYCRFYWPYETKKEAEKELGKSKFKRKIYHIIKVKCPKR
jgi:hypothetical protein